MTRNKLINFVYLSSAGYFISLFLPLSAFAQQQPPAAAPGQGTNPINLNPAQGTIIPNISVANIPSFIITLLLILAVIIAIVFIIWGGIQWILSGGDKGKVESARNHIVAAVIGLIVAFAAYFIINFAFTLLGVQNPLQSGFGIPCLTDPSGKTCLKQ